MSALVEELIEALRRGDGSPKARPAGIRDAALQSLERDLIRLDLINEVARRSLTVTLAEMATVSDWASAMERRRLREGYRRLSELLDDMDEGAVIFAPDGRVEFVNRRVATELREITGIPPDEIIGKTPAEIGVPPDQDPTRDPHELVSLARRRISPELFVLGRWKQTRFKAIYAPDGGVTGVTCVSRDIHQPKLAQIRLDLLSKLTQLVGCVDYDNVAEALAGVPVPELADWCIVHLVEDRHIVRTFVNQRDPDKAALRDACMRVAPDWKRNPLWNEMRLTSGFQLLTDVSDEFLRKFAINEEQYRVWARAGVRSIMVQPIVSRGEIAGLFTLIYTTESGRRYGRDDPELGEELALHAAHIIENARLLKVIRKSDARFRVSVASARTIVYEQDAALRYVWYQNPIVPVSLVGKTHEEALPPSEAEAMTEIKRHVLESGQRVTRELPLTLAGERRIYREAIEPLRDEVGKVVGVIGSSTDITHEKRKQQQLDEALSFRKQMMGVLGHDLRGPLHMVRLATETMVRRGHVVDDGRATVRLIQRSLDRMKEMIETLLDLTRVESFGKLPISPVPTDLGVTAREVVEEACAAWPERTIDLDVRGDLRGRVDPARVKQAMSNLIANALQYGDPQKPARASVDVQGTGFAIRVTNDGPPIPSELMRVMFEPFTRGESPDKSPQGLGLGLYIVQQIAIAHGGTVHVESSAEKGTTFTLLLPRSI